MTADWMESAACRLDPARMWDEARVLEAKQLCSVCPVLTECAEWELAQSDWVPGVIAGRDEMERAGAQKRCADCGRPQPPRRQSSYCKPCKAAREAASRLARVDERWNRCPYCHTVFRVEHGNKRFCVDDHRIRYYRDRSNQQRLARTG